MGKNKRGRPKNGTVRVPVYILKKNHQFLTELAEERGVSVEDLIKHMLDEWFMCFGGNGLVEALRNKLKECYKSAAKTQILAREGLLEAKGWKKAMQLRRNGEKRELLICPDGTVEISQEHPADHSETIH